MRPLGGFWAHGWNITKIIFIYTLFWGTHLQVRRVDGFLRVMAQTTWTRARMCFLAFVHIDSHLGGQDPQKPNFGVWIGVFKPNSRKRKTCILSKLLHCFHCLPIKFCTVINTTKCPSWVVPTYASQNPRWRTAAILKKIEKSLYLGCGSSDYDEIWHDDAVRPSWPLPPLKNRNFESRRWRRSLSYKIENWHISATVWAISTKFGCDAVRPFWPLRLLHRWNRSSVRALE